MTEDCPCVFPSSIAFNCGLELAKMVRSGEILTEKGKALQHAGCLLGSIGNSITPLVYAGDDSPAIPETIEEIADAIIADEASYEAGVSTSGGLFERLALALLQRLLDRLLK